MRSPTPLPLDYDRWFLFALPFLCVSALLSLKSFLPRLLHHHHKGECGEKNLLYFGDIAGIEPKQYGLRTHDRYYPPENMSVTEEYLKDLTVQISVQAHIADRKFKAFNRAAWLVLTAFGLLTLPILGALTSMGARYGLEHNWL